MKIINRFVNDLLILTGIFIVIIFLIVFIVRITTAYEKFESDIIKMKAELKKFHSRFNDLIIYPQNLSETINMFSIHREFFDSELYFFKFQINKFLRQKKVNQEVEKIEMKITEIRNYYKETMDNLTRLNKEKEIFNIRNHGIMNFYYKILSGEIILTASKAGAEEETDELSEETDEEITEETAETISEPVTDVKATTLFNLMDTVITQTFDINSNFSSIEVSIDFIHSRTKSVLIAYKIVSILLFCLLMIIFTGIIIIITKKFNNMITGNVKSIVLYTDQLNKGNFNAIYNQSLFEELNTLSDNIKEIISYDKILIQIKKTFQDIDDNYRTIRIDFANFQETINKYKEKINDTSELFKDLTKYILNFQKNSRDTKFIGLETKTKVHNSSTMVRENIVEIQKLTKPAEKIMDALRIITKITDETGLLSLNAAIEAAKAGTKGKGFRVVATEMGKLAEISSQSASDIAKLAEEIITIIKDITNRSTDSIDALKTIESSVDEVVSFFEDIVILVDKEANESKKILNSIISITQLSDKTSSFTENVIRNNDNIQNKIVDIQKIIKFFKLPDSY